MAVIEMLYRIEEVFNLQIPDQDLVGLTTVGQVIAYVQRSRGPCPSGSKKPSPSVRPKGIRRKKMTTAPRREPADTPATPRMGGWRTDWSSGRHGDRHREPGAGRAGRPRLPRFGAQRENPPERVYRRPARGPTAARFYFASTCGGQSCLCLCARRSKLFCATCPQARDRPGNHPRRGRDHRAGCFRLAWGDIGRPCLDWSASDALSRSVHR